ncbi:MAG: SPOR domain-containing protein [Pseudomonadota bacterium]
MSLFSLFRKNKQDSSSGDGKFYTRAEEKPSTTRGRTKRKKANEANEPVDPVLPEKKRARRRLVGAVALVLAAIIGLPMILDSEPKPLADDIAIQIPAKEKPANPQSAPSRQGTAAVNKAPVAAALDKDEEEIQLPATSAAAAQSTGITTVQTEPKTAPAPVIESEAKVSTAPKQAEKTVDAARAPAIQDNKSAARPDTVKAQADKDKPSGKFVLQVAALATQSKVNELQSKLKTAGIKSYTQKVATESGERIRIRIGPFASKEEADKTREKLGKLGLNGTLVPA